MSLVEGALELCSFLPGLLVLRMGLVETEGVDYKTEALEGCQMANRGLLRRLVKVLCKISGQAFCTSLAVNWPNSDYSMGKRLLVNEKELRTSI